MAGNGGSKTPLTIQSLFPSLSFLHANSSIAAINVTMADAKKADGWTDGRCVHGQMKHFVGPRARTKPTQRAQAVLLQSIPDSFCLSSVERKRVIDDIMGREESDEVGSRESDLGEELLDPREHKYDIAEIRLHNIFRKIDSTPLRFPGTCIVQVQGRNF